MTSKAYAGIGSRAAPPDILSLMREIAQALGRFGYTLRSGAAAGADTAFERGALKESRPVEIYLPWGGFNGRRHDGKRYFAAPLPEAFELAAELHPYWDRLPQAAQKLMARTMHQVLGPKLDPAEKVDFVLCYTPDGATTHTSPKTGDTSQAIRAAARFGVPVYNLANPETRAYYERWLDEALPLPSHGS